MIRFWVKPGISFRRLHNHLGNLTRDLFKKIHFSNLVRKFYPFLSSIIDLSRISPFSIPEKGLGMR
jgi:hypothetical protein